MQQTIPPEVKAAIDRGNKIEAIRLLREATGLDLKEAKEAVEHAEATGSLVMSQQRLEAVDGSEISRALRLGNKLEAIRLYREQTGVDLKEAKEAVEAMPEVRQGTAAGPAPGEVKRSGGRFALAIAIVAGALVTYFAYRPG